MKKQMCDCCGSIFFVANYTQEQLRETVIRTVSTFSDKKSHYEILHYLTKIGFKMFDVKNVMTSLWHEGKIELTAERCRLK